jgi:hypothetical protein
MAKSKTVRHPAKHAPKHAAPKRRGRPPVKKAAAGVAAEIRTLVSEVRDLRDLRSKYVSLLAEHHGLLGTLRELSTELADGARAAWKDYGNAGKAPTARGGRRVRTSSSDVDAMTDKLLSVLPADWKTKEQICAAAKLDPKVANTAFRRLVLGYKRGGKAVPAALRTNGKRGTEGRYRRAGSGA